MEVKGVVSTFMATVDVIRQAIDLGANFIITHEPTWFSGADDTEWLSDDPVYLEKKKLIKEHQIAIWRFHDHMHMDVDDGIYRGFDEELDWGKYRVNDGDLGWFGAVYELPETTLEELAHFFQKALSAYVRDAAQLGMKKGMLVLGHERSEEWGMKHLPAWLKSITEDLPVTFVDAEEPFTYIV